MFTRQDLIGVNTLRALSVEQVEAANSGHPGLPLGAAPMAYALWAGHLNINPDVSNWPNRDRFVLSAGHGSALLYSLLHMSGFDVTIDDLKKFRQLGSKTPGHPEYKHTDGVEVTTGPLGQGVAQAIGMAMAEQHTAALYNSENAKIIDHYTYALVGDGDLMEGISYEAISYAGRQKLSKLIVLYDSNDISLDGDLSQSFDENIEKRFEAANWNYLKVSDGNDLNAISKAIEEAKKGESGKPTLIEVKTIIGYGSPQQGTSDTHGNPLGKDNWAAARKFFDWHYEAFEVPAEAREIFDSKVKNRGKEQYEKWLQLFERYKKSNPEKAKDFENGFGNQLAENYDSSLVFKSEGESSEASRSSSGDAINVLAETIPNLWGGSADLSSSNKTMISNSTDFMPENRGGRNIWFGVREFAMAAMLNGIALHGGTKVFGGTFFVFTDYLKAAVRLSALSKLPVTYVMTHDSVAVGEDGPTHEPIEQLAAFRAMPNLNLIRPADVNETYVSWKIALESEDRPTMLVLSRQNLPVLTNSSDLAEEGVRKGGYIISKSNKEMPDGILIATGSEVSLAVEAQDKLKEKGFDVSVVSMPSQNLFDQQSDIYKNQVLPKEVRNRISIEMGATFGWERYVGLDGITLGIDHFGESGKGEEVIEYLGFTAGNIVNKYIEKFA